MVSSETYQFTSGDVTQGAQVKGIDKGYLCLPNVPSSKSASWGHLNELELLNSAGRNLQGTQLPSSACMSFSNGLGGLSVGQNMDSREGQMGAYFTGSNVQGEVMQTLHLMNPHYSGYADTVSHADNMVLVNPSAVVGGQENSLSHSQLQQQYLGFSTSSSLTQSVQPMLSNVYDSAIVTQPNSQQSSLFLNRFGNNTWTAGNELSFLRSNDTARITQPLAARLACMEPGQQQPNSSLSQLIARPHQALHDDHGSVLQHGISLGLTTDNPQASPGSNQALSLSLSAHHNPLQIQCYGMPPDGAVLNSCQGLLHSAAEDASGDDGYSHNWIGNTNQLRASSHNNQLGPAYQNTALNSSNRQLQVEASVQAIPGFRGYLIGSKYLRAAQVLLEEVVNLGCGIKNSPKPTKLQSWMTGTSLLDSSSQKEENVGSETLITAKEGVACVISTQNASSGTEQNLAVAITERNLQENQELQLKKAKLMAMLDEVDRRYKLYFSQMEAVVNTFESAAGLGAAKTYTALALQTISKHFRGLRDAIGGQIRAASRALGEEDSSPLGLGRLRYVDQQLRQQRALQQLGMMQQHAWRPQRGLPERAVSVLRAWLFEHFLHPYPKDADKHMLARQTGLSRNQVSNWFINARVRLWKPMVEEMYLEELKEAEVDRTSAETSADQKSNTENSDNHRSGISGMDDQGGAGVQDASFKHGRDEVGSKDVGSMQAEKQMVPSYHHVSANMLQDASSLDSGNAHLLQGIIKARNAGVMDAYGQGFKPEDYGRDEEFESQDKHSFAIRGMDPHAFGNYHDQGDGFATMPAGYNGVSLTLGLQHSDSLSLAGSQQQQYYLPPQQQQNLHSQQQSHLQNQGGSSGLFSQLAMSGSRRRLDEVEDYYPPMDGTKNYPSMDGTKNYDALAELQSRKRFASNMYNQG